MNGVHCCRHQAAYHCPDCAGKVLVSPREFKQKVSDALREKHPRPSEYGDIPQAWEVFACMNEVIADLEGEGMKRAE